MDNLQQILDSTNSTALQTLRTTYHWASVVGFSPNGRAEDLEHSGRRLFDGLEQELSQVQGERSQLPSLLSNRANWYETQNAEEMEELTQELQSESFELLYDKLLKEHQRITHEAKKFLSLSRGFENQYTGEVSQLLGELGNPQELSGLVEEAKGLSGKEQQMYIEMFFGDVVASLEKIRRMDQLMETSLREERGCVIYLEEQCPMSSQARKSLHRAYMAFAKRKNLDVKQEVRNNGSYLIFTAKGLSVQEEGLQTPYHTLMGETGNHYFSGKKKQNVFVQVVPFRGERSSESLAPQQELRLRRTYHEKEKPYDSVLGKDHNVEKIDFAQGRMDALLEGYHGQE